MSEFTNEGFNAGYKAGALSERERIIALLDESFIYEEPVVIDRDRLIALIKEENE